MKLEELQSRIQQDVLDGTDHTLPLLKVPNDTSRKDRLAVYQNAYKIRLTEILGETRETLWTYMGDEAFYKMANRYFDAHPSDHPNARHVAKNLVRFLQQSDAYKGLPVLADLAALEGALEDAFDAPDCAPVTMDDLAALPAEKIAELQLEFAPSARWFSARTNGVDIFQALKAEETPPAPGEITKDDAKDGQTVLVWRIEEVSHYRELEAEEAMLLKEAMAGKSFGTLCEMAAIMNDPDTAAARVAGVLTNWINSQVLCGLVIGEGSN